MLILADLFGWAFGPILRRHSIYALMALWEAAKFIAVELVLTVLLELFYESFGRRSTQVVVV